MEDGYQQFQQLHLSQLQRIPERYWRSLYSKLQSEVYDAGEYFMMSPSRGRWNVVVTHRGKISTKDPNSIFLVDHAWTFQPQIARQQLMSIPGLAGRMATLMDLDGIPCLSGEEADSEGASEEERQSSPSSEQQEDKEEVEEEVEEEKGEEKEEGVVEEEEVGEEGKDVEGAATSSSLPKSREIVSSSSSGSDGDGDKRRQPRKALQPPVRGEEGYDSLSGYESYAGYESCDREEEEEGYKVFSTGVELQPEVIPPVPSQVEEAPPTEDVVARILESMWQFCHPYSINNSLVPVWYIMDEFGSRIQHSDTPSVAMTTFFYVPKQLAFSLLWPLKDLKFGDKVTRDYLPEGVHGGLSRACHLLPWTQGTDCLTLNDPRWQELPQCTVPEMKERCNESLPDPTLPSSPLTPPCKVYTDFELVRTFLTHNSFQITEDRGEASILWISDHFKDFGSLLPHQFINQFPCENVLTCKDLLVQVAKRSRQLPQGGEVGVANWVGPSWLPETYNLLYELPHLVHRHLELKESGDSNVWIVKPWNLGRGLDIYITSSLNQIIRLAQAGPKIASRYISDPVLFNRPEVGLVKFDIRYIVMLRSVHPLEVYVYNVFWLRFANKAFSMDSFDDYEKHFTVMNYQKNVELKQIHYDEFISLHEQQYPSHPWETIQSAIFSMLAELFRAACSAPPPAGIAPCSQCRAIYAVDLMLEWNRATESCPGIQPKLLEVNYSPDCIRACRYHPSFFNHVFETLFLDSSAWSSDLPITKLV